MRTFFPPSSISAYTSRINSCITGGLTDRKRMIAIMAPPTLIAFMYPVFQLLAEAIESDRIAWCLGLATYWLVWGTVFPIVIIGIDNIRVLVSPRKIDKKVLMLLAIPLIGAIGARLVPGMGGYEKESALIVFLLVSSTFGNGFFEEVLWRGVYTRLFPTNAFYRMIWPSVWFGIWHYIPVSASNSELMGLIGMMVGPTMMGLYLSYLTKKTNTLWWAILAHIIGGIIMIA